MWICPDPAGHIQATGRDGRGRKQYRYHPAWTAHRNEVAAMLRNTRTVCRRCYVHPAGMEAWREGRLGPEMEAIRRRFSRPLKGLDASESAVLRWLSGGATPARPSPR